MKLMISGDVRRQIDEQVLFIAKHSVDNAFAWEIRLRAAISRIVDAPGHAVDEDASDRAGYTVHKLVFERTYLVFYVINEPDAIIEVVSFRHGARMPGPSEP